jgi:hypothetical protein
LFSSGDYLSSNRLFSYCTFIIKDIYEYITAYLSDGTNAIVVRRAPVLLKKYEEELNSISNK